MIISTPEELRLYLPTHVLDDISNVAGAIDNSVHDFLCERIGAPLLNSVEKYYHEHYLLDDGTPNDEAIQTDIINHAARITPDSDPYITLISLCQRCVVFDAFARLADIQTLSVHDAGINVVETKGYDSAPDKTIANYKAQMVKEAHAASNRLLIWLEEAQKRTATMPLADQPDQPESPDTPEQPETPDTPENPDQPEQPDTPSPLSEIISLWKQSAYYYYADGLLFNTATEFGLYVNIYDSREKFIQLLPDIRYCQETHIEAEIGEELLLELINKHKEGALTATEAKAYRMLQRALSLMVEARSPLFKRSEAKDEAQGQIKLAMEYIRKHLLTPQPPHHPHHNPEVPGWPSTEDFDHHRRHDEERGMLISSLI